MLLPNDSIEQQGLYEILMKISNNRRVSTIKGAALNLILAVVLKISSSSDEAILQWNELSSIAEDRINKHFSSRDSLPDSFTQSKIKF